jgi:Cu(I)/Ag(I) efflux system protein CusF
MKVLKQVVNIAALSAALALSLGSAAQTPATATVKATEMAEGEVRKVDKENKKITLKHGEIKSLDMPPMTMVFQVDNAAMLDKVASGDKVRFAASNDGGKLKITEIEPVK